MSLSICSIVKYSISEGCTSYILFSVAEMLFLVAILVSDYSAYVCEP